MKCDIEGPGVNIYIRIYKCIQKGMARWGIVVLCFRVEWMIASGKKERNGEKKPIPFLIGIKQKVYV